MGFAQRVDEDARSAALQIAAEIATLAPLSVQGHKRALNLVADAPPRSTTRPSPRSARSRRPPSRAPTSRRASPRSARSAHRSSRAASAPLVVRGQQSLEVVVEDEEHDRERDRAQEPRRPAVVAVEDQPPQRADGGGEEAPPDCRQLRARPGRTTRRRARRGWRPAVGPRPAASDSCPSPAPP